jgi:predicted transglutaminase-like cysteine proteinase
MPYNWEGDLILQNTIMENKRFVIGSEDKQIKTDIREWISFEDNNVMKEILRKLSNEKGLPSSRGPGDFDKRAMIIWDFIAQNIKYVHDSEKQKKEDFWLFPPEIITLCEGDCEDGSFLLASLLIASGISPFCVRVVLGEVFDEKGKSIGGHCWPVYKNEIGQWCILESTLDNIPSRMPEADKLTEKGQYFQYVPIYCFNNYHLWEILPEKDIGSTSNSIEKYLKLRHRKVNMKKTRLPSGGWLSRITGDWEPGHLEITEVLLRKYEFSKNAINVVGDASQDPDFYDWNTSCAHAQTENNSDGKTIESIEVATGKYIKWIKGLNDKLIEETAKDVRSGLFILGYILHGIQDLSTHKGLTNAQHSYVSKLFGKKNDPDHDVKNRERAKDYSEGYTEFLKTKYNKPYNKLVEYKGRSLPWDKLMIGAKEKLLGKGWDLTPSAFIEYSELSKKYKKIKKDYPIESTLWKTDEVFERLLKNLG